MATRVFTAFDYDNDAFLRTALAGQSKLEDSPFEICDWSVKEPFTGDWKKKVRERMKKCGLVVVICGEHTDTATGLNAELEIAQDEELPYFLLKGYANKVCKWPKSAKSTDKMYDWTWPNLKLLIAGRR